MAPARIAGVAKQQEVPGFCQAIFLPQILGNTPAYRILSIFLRLITCMPLKSVTKVKPNRWFNPPYKVRSWQTSMTRFFDYPKIRVPLSHIHTGKTGSHSCCSRQRGISSLRQRFGAIPLLKSRPSFSNSIKGNLPIC